MPRGSKQAGSGVSLWQSRDDIARSRRRATIGAVLLGLLALFWLAGLGADDPGENALLGLILLEVFTLAPFAAVAARARRLTKLLHRVDALGEAELAEQAEAMRDADEERLRLARLVAALPPGPAAEVAERALDTVEEAAESRRRLLHRRAQLRALRDVTRSGTARSSVERSLAGCEEDLENLEVQSETLCAAIAELVDETDQGAVDAQVDAVSAAAERVRLVAETLRDLGAVDAPMTRLLHPEREG